MNRLVADLQLSEAQAAEAGRLHDTYSTGLDTIANDLETQTTQKIRALWFQVVPELDLSVDISNLPDERKAKVKVWRDRLAKEGDPILDELEYIHEVNKISLHNMNLLNTNEARARATLLEPVEAILSDQQRQRLPRALMRMELNMHGFSPVGNISSPLFKQDPVWHLDVVGLLEEASADDAELSPWSDVIRNLDPVPPDSPLEEVQRTIEEYEQALCAQLRLNEEMYERWLEAFLESYREEKFSVTGSLWRQRKNQYRSVFQMRQFFADRIAALANETIDPARGAVWLDRFQRATCPSIFKEDSVDVIVRWLMETGFEDPAISQAVTAIYDQYRNSRDALRQTAFRAEIAEYCAVKLFWTDKKTPEKEYLKEAHRQRLELAESARNQLRAILPPDRHAEFDDKLKDHYEGLATMVEAHP
jgi:hypothetical protein